MQEVLLWMKKNPRSVAYSAALGIPALLLFVGGAMITAAVIFAILSTLAFAVLIYKMKVSKIRLVGKAYNFIAKHPLGSDIGFTVLVYSFAPVGVTGMLGAGLVCVMTSALLLGMEVRHENSVVEVERPGGQMLELSQGSVLVRQEVIR